MMKTQKIFVVLGAAVVLILAGCGPTNPVLEAATAATTSPSLVAPTAAPAMPLNDTDWLLESLHGQAVVPATQVTLSFAKDSFNGSDGCNQYNGSYMVNGDKIMVDKNIAATKMACEKPLMEQASAYITMLGQAAVYNITGEELTLLDEEGKTLASFKHSLESSGQGPQNATYRIDGETITLVNGVAEIEAAPGSASKKVTRYYGDGVDIDLNGDGRMDSALLLVQDSGGSGVFFFVAAALNTADGAVGSNAIFIGDRIAPQNIMVDPENPAQFIVNYADRKADEPMSAQPSQDVSRWFTLEGDVLIEVPSPAQNTQGG